VTGREATGAPISKDISSARRRVSLSELGLSYTLGGGSYPIWILQIPAATKGLIKLYDDGATVEFGERRFILFRETDPFAISRLDLGALLIIKFGLVLKSNGSPLLRQKVYQFDKSRLGCCPP
jgi:hypothetical protein